MSRAPVSRPSWTERYFSPGMTGEADSDSMRTKFSAVFTMRIVPAQSTGMAAGVLGFFGGRIFPKAPNHDAPGEGGFFPDGFAQAPSKKTRPTTMGMRYFIKEARMGRAAGFWQKLPRLSHHEKPPIARPCEQ